MIEIAKLNALSRFLNECIRRCEAGFKLDYPFLSKELNIDPLAFKIAILKGYFTDLGNGVLKPNIVKAELIHCRDIMIQLELIDEVKKIKPYQPICLACGEKFTYKSKKRKFCSNKCRITYHRNN